MEPNANSSGSGWLPTATVPATDPSGASGGVAVAVGLTADGLPPAGTDDGVGDTSEGAPPQAGRTASPTVTTNSPMNRTVRRIPVGCTAAGPLAARPARPARPRPRCPTDQFVD